MNVALSVFTPVVTLLGVALGGWLATWAEVGPQGPLPTPGS
jgi:hypothetical protein